MFLQGKINLEMDHTLELCESFNFTVTDLMNQSFISKVLSQGLIFSKYICYKRHKLKSKLDKSVWAEIQIEMLRMRMGQGI